MQEKNENITADAVVLTLPVPQLMKLQGDVQSLLEPWKSNLDSVVYSSRYAMGLYFDGQNQLDVPWDCKYVDDNDCIRFVGIDNAKRGVGRYFAICSIYLLHYSSSILVTRCDLTYLNALLSPPLY